MIQKESQSPFDRDLNLDKVTRPAESSAEYESQATSGHVTNQQTGEVYQPGASINPPDKRVALRIRNLNKSFGRKQVVFDMNFDVYYGEVFGFLGPNGAGKTTVLKSVLGFYQYEQGEVEIGGLSTKKSYEQAMSRVGGIIENPEMYLNYTAWQNLKLYARTQQNISDDRIREVVKLLRLENRIQDKVKKYSLGMKQRLGLTQALLHNPDVLLLDEPTNGLDPAGIHELREILKNLAHEQGKAILVSSHILSEMQQLCDRVAIIQKGHLLGVETMGKLMGDKHQSYYRFQVTPTAQAAEILRPYFPKLEVEEGWITLPVDRVDVTRVIKYLLAKEIQITGIVPVQNSLEKIFLDVTGGGDTIA